MEACFCAEMPSLITETRVHIISHHREIERASATAPILERALREATWVVRDPAAEIELPHDPERRHWLLWPDAPPITQAEAHQGPSITLVVPDGSWQQARRLRKRMNTGALELRSLPSGARTQFHLRTAPPDPNRLCTLEAVARALGIIEGHAVEDALL